MTGAQLSNEVGRNLSRKLTFSLSLQTVIAGRPGGRADSDDDWEEPKRGKGKKKR